MTGSKNNEGFTLLEVLVSFVILSLSLSVLFRTFGDGFRNIDITSKRSVATRLAQSKLASLGVVSPLKIGAFKGKFDEEYSWQYQISPYTPSWLTKNNLSTLNAYRINLSVYWHQNSAKQTRSISLSAIKLQEDSR